MDTHFGGPIAEWHSLSVLAGTQSVLLSAMTDLLRTRMKLKSELAADPH
jgi:hypothetical protein